MAELSLQDMTLPPVVGAVRRKCFTVSTVIPWHIRQARDLALHIWNR